MTRLSLSLAAARRRGPAGEDGITLLFVLIFMILVMVMIFGSITFAGTSLQASVVVKDARQQQYAADAGIEMAVKKVASDPRGMLGSPMSGGSCPFTFTNLNGHKVTVTCASADSSSGGYVPGRPRNALLTLDPANPVQITGSAQPVRVGGNAYISSSLQFDSPSRSFVVTGDYRQVQAGGGCPDQINATGTVTCPDSADSNWGADPGWAAQASPGAATSPTCDHGAAKFTGGKYLMSPTAMLDVVALTDSKCQNISTLWFQPGVYELASGVTFDQNAVAGRTTARVLVAGTPSGWTPLANGANGTPPTDGTACNPSAAGVQILLDGDASIVASPIQGSGMTLCAGPTSATATQPAIAIYGTGARIKTRFANGDHAGNKWMGIYIHGEVYLPTSNLQIVLHSQEKAIFDGGAVIYGGSLDVTGFQQIESVFGLPACSATNKCRNDRDVVFTASVDGHPWTTSEVRYNDNGGVYPASATTVKTWSVMP